MLCGNKCKFQNKIDGPSLTLLNFLKLEHLLPHWLLKRDDHWGLHPRQEAQVPSQKFTSSMLFSSLSEEGKGKFLYEASAGVVPSYSGPCLGFNPPHMQETFVPSKYSDVLEKVITILCIAMIQSQFMNTFRPLEENHPCQILYL